VLLRRTRTYSRSRAELATFEYVLKGRGDMFAVAWMRRYQEWIEGGGSPQDFSWAADAMGGKAMYVEQALADQWTHEAQKFVGYWHGVQVTGVQLSAKVNVTDVPWEEPLDETDGCVFCERMTEELVEERILGFQHEMDNEVVRINSWVRAASGDMDISEQAFAFTADREEFAAHHAAVMKAYALAPAQFDPRPYDFISLPFYLKWRLCVNWNHVLVRWLDAHPTYEYSFEKRLPVLKETKLTQAEQEDADDDHVYAATIPPPLTPAEGGNLEDFEMM
jgi:hypothetical protein